MKDISELNLPDDVRYTEDHEWAKLNDNTVKVGISDYAQDQLGGVIFVELPEVGSSLDKGEEFGTLESTKAVSEIYMPIAGEILSVNTKLEESPELVNQDPYHEGWMIEVKPNDSGVLDVLMTKDAYLEMLKKVD